MAELSTVARPYAEALFQVAKKGDLGAWTQVVSNLALVADDAQMQAAIADPKLDDTQIYGLFTGVLSMELPPEAQNFVRTLVSNSRLALLPEIARQFRHLKNLHEGIADADIASAFPMSDAQVGDLVSALEKKFGVRLRAKVTVDASLLGGVRVTVGDEVLDTTVRARLEQMRAALTA
ncbi:MAG TPA: F0F1 ATP synthase subunit delta [Burkholderiaceae bacterium]|nr:F0F1 ATP synthase subunit delta [Burkholderiaceae bacterium]